MAIQMLKKCFEQLERLDNEMMSLLSHDEEELAAIDEYEIKYQTIKGKGENFLGNEIGHGDDIDSGSSVSCNTSNHGASGQNYKLPKFEIRKFDGDLKEWLGFWSQFQKIHEDSSIHDSDKFQYLVQTMMPNTRAAKLVNSYPQSADNYHLVIAVLQDRFGDKILWTVVYVSLCLC